MGVAFETLFFDPFECLDKSRLQDFFGILTVPCVEIRDGKYFVFVLSVQFTLSL